ncbi:MAG: phage late control D family protein [Gammaproteobacteria bacterium]
MTTAAAERFTTLESVSGQSRGFYVPVFELRIEGAGLPQDVLRDVIQITYTDDIEALDSFEVTVSNWHHERNQFKYIGSEPAPADGGGSSAAPASSSGSGAASAPNNDAQRYRLFEPCGKEVELRMGYIGEGELALIMKGHFTSMEPSFASGGPATLNVRGLNKLHRLRRKKYSDGWPKQAGETITDSEIVGEIARARDPDTDQNRFPLPIVTNPRNEPAIDFIGQKNEYDIDFLWKRAKERGYVVTVRLNEQGEEELYFGPSDSNDNPLNYRLDWGKSLISFNPTITNANQYRSVTVNGWDRRRQRAISVTVDIDDEEVNRINPDIHHFICDAREEHVVDEPVFTENQARERARSILTDQLKQMVKAKGSTVGLPSLRAGSRLEIAGVGGRLNGIYFVTKTTHTFNDSGYVTEFEARREGPSEAAGG